MSGRKKITGEGPKYLSKLFFRFDGVGQLK